MTAQNLPGASLDPSLLKTLQRVFPSSRRLDARDLRELLSMLRPVLIPDGETLFREGDPPGPAWIILEGEVRVELQPTEGRSVLLGRLGPGDFVGDMSLVDGRPRAANAFVDKPMWALLIEAEVWAKMKADAHPGALWLISEIDRHVSTRVRAMYDRVARLKGDPSLAEDLPAPPPNLTFAERLRSFWRRA